MTQAKAVSGVPPRTPDGAGVQEPQPVAWQWRLKGRGKWGPWKAIKCEDYAAQYFRTAQLQRGHLDAEAYEVRALYASPAAALTAPDVTERAIAIIQQYLLYDSQRAVSWHEVQDCISAIRSNVTFGETRRAGVAITGGDETAALDSRNQHLLTAPDVGVLTAEMAKMWVDCIDQLARTAEKVVGGRFDGDAPEMTALRAIADGRHVVASAETVRNARRYEWLRDDVYFWQTLRDWYDGLNCNSAEQADAAIDAALQRSWTTPTGQENRKDEKI